MQSRNPCHLGCLFFFHFLQFTLLARAQQNVTCFLPNGSKIADEASKNDFYAACPTSAGGDGQYMCCKTSYPFNDVCNEDGLCARQNNPSLGDDQGLLRSTCTDPSWTSPSCLQLCVTGLDYLGNEANATEQFVKQCDDGSWCCEAQTPPLSDQNVINSTMQNQVNACCSQGKGVFINNGKVTTVNPNATATSASATTTATQSSASPTRSPPPPPPHHSDAGAIAGGVVGGVAGLVLVVVSMIYFRRMKRNPKTMPEDSAGQEMIQAWNLHEKHGDERFETDGTPVTDKKSGPYEM